MNKITIGILGAALNNGNLGVNALGFCLLDVIKKSVKKHDKKVKVIFFSTDKREDVDQYVKLFDIDEYEICLPISLKKRAVLKNFKNKIGECDLVVDITGGDSFSDIYGNNRFIRETIGKYIAERKSKIVLAPQTIGPFKTKLNRVMARRAMDKAGIVFARDEMSYEYTKDLVKKATVNLTSDLAFDLPYSSEIKVEQEGTKIGLNINALMWNGGYNRNNQFELKFDYHQYIYGIVEKLLENKENTIYLISHVVHQLEVENDYLVCKHIQEKYPQCVLVDPFATPMDAKTLIKDMDIFIGGRMHSTIAASSTGVAVVPVSYSRKFEGLYHSIGYQNLINGRALSTEEAIERTLTCAEERKRLSSEIKECSKLAKERLEIFYRYFDELISNL